MGNINDYALPQVKRLLGKTDIITEDADLLTWLVQAVADTDLSLRKSMSVTQTGSSYVLSPAVGSTDGLWNVLAKCAASLYRADEYNSFLKEMGGMSSIRDAVTSMNRGLTMEALSRFVAKAEEQYQAALFDYLLTASGSTIGIEQIGLRDPDWEDYVES